MNTENNHTLLVGTGETDITPLLGTSLAGHFMDRKAEEIEDPLKAKAVVIDNGETQLALLCLDLISIPRKEVAAIRQRAAEFTGLSPSNIFVACTHTHTGPATRGSHSVRRDNAYCEWMAPKAADSIILAFRRRRPARLAWGHGDLPEHLFCRRFRMRDGTVVTNPGRNHPDVVEPICPIDPLVGVLYVEDLEGKPLAVVARYSLHYVGTRGMKNAVSADYYGHFAKAVRAQLGEECAVLLFNGNSGQINNVNVFDPDQPTGVRQAQLVARSLAGEVMRVIGRLRVTDKVALGVASEEIQLKRKTLTARDLEIADAILAAGEDEETNASFEWLRGAPIPPRLQRYYARGCKILAEMPESYTSEVQALRIGDSAWVGLPGEIFVETGQAICDASAAGCTFVIGLANDSLGYFPTDRAFQEGGYETWASSGNPIAPSEGILIRHSVSCLRKLFGAKSDNAKA